VALSKILWHKNSNEMNYIDASDLFPWMDLMRWLSFIVCINIFVIVLIFAFMFFSSKPVAPTRHATNPGFRRFSLWWLGLLTISPLLLKFLNGELSAEHIPAIEGIVYFLCSLIALYSYNRIHINDAIQKPKSNVYIKALLFASIILTVMAIIMAIIKEQYLVYPLSWLGWDVRFAAFIGCIGILLIFVATHLLFKHKYSHFEPRRNILVSFSVIIGVCLLTYLPPIVWLNAIKLSQGEHTGSPLQSLNTPGFVGADLCVCP